MEKITLITLIMLLFIGSCMIFLIAVFVKRLAAHEVFEPLLMTEVQSEDYAKVRAQLERCTDLDQLEQCFEPMKQFQNKYKGTIAGDADTTILIDLYLKKQDYFSKTATPNEYWPDFVEHYN